MVFWLLLSSHLDDPVGQGEGQASQDETVQEGDDGQDEGPADAASAEVVVVGVGAADASDVVVIPAGGEGQNADGQTNA